MRHLRPNDAGGLQSAAPLHLEVQDHYVGCEHSRLFNRLQTVGRGGHNLYSVMAEVGAQGITDSLVTIDDEYPDGADRRSR